MATQYKIDPVTVPDHGACELALSEDDAEFWALSELDGDGYVLVDLYDSRAEAEAALAEQLSA